MSDDLIPPVPPAERVFKVPPPRPEDPSPQGASGRGDGIYGQAGKKSSGDVIKNKIPPAGAGKAVRGSLLENFRQLLTKGIHLPGRQAPPAGSLLPKGAYWSAFGRKSAGKTEPRSLFASPIRLQGMDSVKQLLTTGIDLDSVNKVLTGVLVLLIVYAIIAAVNKKSSIGKLMQSISHIKFEKSTSGAIEAYQPVDYYLGQVRGRDLFNPVGEVRTRVMPEPLAPPEPPKPKLKEMVGGLSVVGIAWGETPKAMIQDAATQEIYFLKKDDLIGKTEIKVKDILRGKIVISYGEEEMEL
ncbi:MAG: hypothetical protein HY210_05780 [Candidatus Omnitrophica bacterium]|nr:hypothetical protein [Candidatus Omnitrophota bacterium]